MVRDKPINQRKLDYRSKLEKLLSEYKNALVCTVDNVGSLQMQQIRIALRGKAVMLCGKNTIIRKVMKDAAKENEKLEKLRGEIFGNVAIVFSNDDLATVRTIVVSNKMPAAARVGVFAPDDCWIQPGATGLDPGQTNFFQALNIATKIVKGSIEIINPVHLIKKGDKVTPSHVSLLSKLDIKPFFYGMQVTHVYENGSLYPAEVLDITKDELTKRFFAGVQKITSLCLAIGFPTLSTIPHSFARGLRNLIALAVTSDDIDFKMAAPYKEYLADPAAYAAKHGLSTGPAPKADGTDKKEAAPAAAAKEEPKKDDDDDDGVFAGGLFGDD